MEVMIPVQDMDFDFNSAKSSPYPTAPSTPRGFGNYYTSAPSSPSRLSEFYQEFNDFMISSNDSSIRASSFDFAFDVSEEINHANSVTAEDLFDGGMIKPMKPPQPRSSSRSNADSSAERSPLISPSLRSPISHGKKMVKGAFLSRNKKEDEHPFETEARRGNKSNAERSRGRERNPSLSSSSRRAARSLSPLRVSQYPWEEDQQQQEISQHQKHQSQMDPKSSSLSSSGSSSSSSALASSSSSKGQRKWRLKDFFLFRSASEGRASEKDHLKKYTALFRGTDRENPASTPGSSSRRRAPISAHELHYTANRAAKEELKKKTPLPYKPGFFGRIAFNPAIAMANGFPVYK